MNDSKTLNSTEKLLNTIRGETCQTPEKNSIPDQYSLQATTLKKNIRYSLVAGVFIEDQFICLVLTGKRKPGAGRELVKWAYIEVPEFQDINHIRFPAFLKLTLSEFISKYKNVAIWTAIDSKYLKLHNLNLPDLHHSKIANAALWGLKKEIEVDPEKEIFDFEFIEDTQVNGIKKKNVVAFAGDKKQILFLKQLFASAGYPLTGITAIPFALQNYIWTDTIKAGPTPIIIVNVARNYSEISCLSGKGILLTRNIRTGSYSLVEELHGPGKQVDVTDILSPELGRNSAEFNSIEPSAARLLGKIIRTGDYCSNKFAVNEPMSKFLFFGETDNCKAFMEYAAEQIPGRVERFSPFEDQSTSLTIKMPWGARERAGIIPALGMALSENDYTPNFLFTYLQKSIQAKYKKMNMTIIAACVAGLMVCASMWGWFNTQKNNEINQKTELEEQIARYSPIVSQQLLSRKISEAQKKAAMINRYAHDFLPLAIINEICSLTPEKISITSFDSDFMTLDSETDKASKEKKGKKRSVTIKGVVTADFNYLEPILTGYILKLGDSSLFGGILLQDKEIVKNADSAILKFTADMEIFQ